MDGAKFGDRLSYENYEAIMNYARILPPSVKENYVDIAGGNSSIDLTTFASLYLDGPFVKCCCFVISVALTTSPSLKDATFFSFFSSSAA